MAKLPVSLIVTTFERPESLSLVLESIARQERIVPFEVVVADDGSADETRSVVAEFAARVDFAVRWVTHPRQGFQLAKCRNNGARVARGEYLVFLDGDCVIPSDHVARHWRAARCGRILSGYTCHLTPEDSTRLDRRRIAQGDLHELVESDRDRQLRRLDRKATLYRWLHHRSKPRLRGGNFSLAATDYERINGFDQNFVGWGCEDDDFGMRAKRAGIRMTNAYRELPTFHLWHPPTPSCPRRWKDGRNVGYLHRACRWTRCLNGLHPRDPRDLTYLLRGSAAGTGDYLAALRRWHRESPFPPDLEVVARPGNARFRGLGDCRLLIATGIVPGLRRLAARADLVLSDLDIGCRTPRLPLQALLEPISFAAA